MHVIVYKRRQIRHVTPFECSTFIIYVEKTIMTYVQEVSLADMSQKMSTFSETKVDNG